MRIPNCYISKFRPGFILTDGTYKMAPSTLDQFIRFGTDAGELSL